MKRSRELISRSDLRKLLKLARTDIDAFFMRHQGYASSYKGREVLVALCQGAALHYVDGRNGVKDFDVWFFFPELDGVLPYRRRGKVDFGPSRFGKHPDDVEFQGRRIDVLMRSHRSFLPGRPVESLHRYLSQSGSITPALLARKAAVGLFPEAVFGRILWPISD